MLTNKELKEILASISDIMEENFTCLSELDARNGDGDLGSTMRNAFAAAHDSIKSDTGIIGSTLMQCAMSINAAAPSTSGTIISLWMIGMAKTLSTKESATLAEMADAMMAGIQNVCEKAKSKPGEKTILDAIFPAVKVLQENSDLSTSEAMAKALDAANVGMDSTKDMLPIHGRAAYYGEKSLGMIDGGAVAGKLIFEAINRYYS